MVVSVVSMNHRDLCKIAARWLLSRNGRGLYASAYEVAFDGGFADAIGVSCPDPAADTAIRFAEYARLRGIRDAKMNARLRRKQGGPVGPLFADVPVVEAYPHELTRAAARVARAVAPTIAVCEVKRTRSDWLADARAQKLRRYEPAATECWLLVAHGVVSGADNAVASLTADGLPDGWGVLLADPRYSHPSRLRNATPHRAGEDWEVGAWSARMLRSMAYRDLLRVENDATPKVDPDADGWGP